MEENNYDYCYRFCNGTMHDTNFAKSGTLPRNSQTDVVGFQPPSSAGLRGVCEDYMICHFIKITCFGFTVVVVHSTGNSSCHSLNKVSTQSQKLLKLLLLHSQHLGHHLYAQFVSNNHVFWFD